MNETSPRQLLYALVAGGFTLVVAVLVIGAAAASLVPAWWTALIGAIVVGVGVWSALNWRRTGPVLLGAIALFLLWAIGTLLTAR